MIDAAIVGLGRWGRVLVTAVHGKSDRRRFTRGVSRNPEAHRDFAATHRIGLVADLDAVLADRSIDAVALATPHSLHCQQIIAVATAGKAVFCEKPLTLTKADAEVAIEACRKTGVVLGVGTDKRFFPAIAELMRLARDGELGRILHLEAHFSNEVAGTFAEWRYSLGESPAGGMTGTGIHMLDALIALGGPVRRVQTLLPSHRPPPARSTASRCCSNSAAAPADYWRWCARRRLFSAFTPLVDRPRPKRSDGPIWWCAGGAPSRST
jgi:predicted dehydrogenase